MIPPDNVVSVISPIWSYESGYAPFARNGDTFLVASPGGIYYAIASPSTIHQIATRRTDFIKPVEHYHVVEIFGRNVLTSEGATWRDHRKVTSTSFNEKSNALVWKESLYQAEKMVEAWRRDGRDDKEGAYVQDLYRHAATTSLHVVSRSGFGVRLLWPGEEEKEVSKDEGNEYSAFSCQEPRKGYTMNFKESLGFMLGHIIWMAVLPKWMLSRSSP